MSFSRPCLIACLAVLYALPATAHAGEGWFGGLRVAPWVNRADALLNVDRGPDGQPLRKRGTSSAGLPAQRRVDLELAYSDGDADADAGSVTRPAGTPRTFRLAGVGTFPLSDGIGLTGRVGAYRGDIELANAYRINPDESVHPTYGMGVRYDLSANLRLQGGWDRYHLGASLHPGDGGVDLLTIGLKYRF